MSQRNWIILVLVVIVLVLGYVFWPGAAGDGGVAPQGGAETTQPADDGTATD